MKKDLLYITWDVDSVGVTLKIRGQINALRKGYSVTPFIITTHPRRPLYYRIISLILSQIKVIFLLLFSFRNAIVYYRYIPANVFLNIVLGLRSNFQDIFVEYNAPSTEYKYHPYPIFLKKIFLLLHRISLYFFITSNAKILIVVRELKKIDNLHASQVLVMPNGYTLNSENINNCYEKIFSDLVNKIQKIKSQNKKLLIFVSGVHSPTYGIEKMLDLVSTLNEVGLVLVGKSVEKVKTDKYSNLKNRVVKIGHIPPECLRLIYQYVDFGIGPTALEKVGLKEASPLKVREYLWHGLPVIINYYDLLLENKWLKKYICWANLEDIEKIREFLNRPLCRAKLREFAREQLAWEAQFKKIGLL